MLDYILGIAGLGGIGLGVAAWFIGLPALLGIINNLLTIASPLLKGISELVVWYISELWDGAKTILSNASTFVVIASVAVLAAYAGTQTVSCSTPKTSVVKTSTPVPKTKDTSNWWDDVFNGSK